MLLKSKKPKSYPANILRKVESLSLFQLTSLFITVILTSAIALALLGPENGLIATFTSGTSPESTSDAHPTGATPLDALYFSVITITSLGYGDFRPQGYGRFIATTEVIAGLILMALIVSKLASERTSTYTRLIYTSDCERRLTDFISRIRLLSIDLQEAQRQHNHPKKLESINGLGIIIATLANYYRFQRQEGSLGEAWAHKNSMKIIKEIRAATHELILSGKSSTPTSPERLKLDQILIQIPRVVNAIAIDRKSTDFEILKTDIEKIIISYKSFKKTGLVSSKHTAITPLLIKNVIELLPPKPWNNNTHKEVAKKLFISSRIALKAIDAIEKEKKSNTKSNQPSLDYQIYLSTISSDDPK